MAAAEQSGPGPDLYQLLGVSRQASPEEIAQASRRQARTEHPDARPADAAAPGRFRDLAEAWQVLGDPARRAVYDRALARERQPAARVPAARIQAPARHLGLAAGMRRTSGWPCWRSWRCGTWPGTGAGRGEPGVGGPGPGAV